MDKIEHPQGVCHRFYKRECNVWKPKSEVNSPFRRYRQFLEQYPAARINYNSKFGFPEQLPSLPRNHPKRHFGPVSGVTSRLPEDLIRDKHGIKRIGKGWVSETILYRQVKERLDVEVIQHGSPEWLGGQHFDVWIPDLSIAIEYHGKQHFEPVDFFGGVEGLKATKLRDERKRKLSLENNVQLIELKRGYDIEEVILQIYEIARKA